MLTNSCPNSLLQMKYKQINLKPHVNYSIMKCKESDITEDKML